jgi:hypothetical protein
LVARLGLGLSLVAGVILASVPLPLAAKTATAQMRVTATVTPSCLITSQGSRLRPYVRVLCPVSASPFRIYSTAKTVNIDF